MRQPQGQAVRDSQDSEQSMGAIKKESPRGRCNSLRSLSPYKTVTALANLDRFHCVITIYATPASPISSLLRSR
jgi:hypothetical protein